MQSDKQQTEISKAKAIKKKIRRAFRPKNIGSVLVLIATIALLLTSLLPYMF